MVDHLYVIAVRGWQKKSRARGTAAGPRSDILAFQTKDTLAEKLFAIEETGPTALGPAMLTAIGMAQSNRGAKIILCTDGIANTGTASGPLFLEPLQVLLKFKTLYTENKNWTKHSPFLNH